jgi:hypothetical protein
MPIIGLAGCCSFAEVAECARAPFLGSAIAVVVENRGVQSMSVLPKADMVQQRCNVRYVPSADMQRDAPSLADVIARIHDEVEHSPLLVPVLRQHGVGLAFLQPADEALHQGLLFRRRIRLE